MVGEGVVVVVAFDLGIAQDRATLEGLVSFLTESRVLAKRPICAAKTKANLVNMCEANKEI